MSDTLVLHGHERRLPIVPFGRDGIPDVLADSELCFAAELVGGFYLRRGRTHSKVYGYEAPPVERLHR